ncbi:MAG: hypothetical protein QXG39_02650 [Candidatus Aenigmatarchaeota archaeon]
MFSWFKKKEQLKQVETVQPTQVPQPEPKVEVSKLPPEQKIDLMSAQLEVISERLKNIERMIEEIYKIAKS